MKNSEVDEDVVKSLEVYLPKILTWFVGVSCEIMDLGAQLRRLNEMLEELKDNHQDD
jgi:hypothetical protein